ncbi:MAG: type II toxin-antitoxin system PemK/MazF family toxin [Actinomycetota bacterium]|nr:type II toxin-antitoxin system PemK/MazF family toxin [Actinomycetota bacterium]
MTRGDVYDADLPIGLHPVVVVTRNSAIPILRSVCVAVVTSTIRGAPTEVPVGRDEGLNRDSVVNCDDLVTASKALLGRWRGSLGPEATRQLDDALRIALGLD